MVAQSTKTVVGLEGKKKKKMTELKTELKCEAFIYRERDLTTLPRRIPA